MQQFKTSELATRKQVEIDGHKYTVRRMGNIEQLDMSQYFRRLQNLSKAEADGKLTKAQEDEIEGISRKISNLFISLFDDGGDQSKSKKLVSSLTDDEITFLINQIFTEKEDVKQTS